jgi:hypothetical protein
MDKKVKLTLMVSLIAFAVFMGAAAATYINSRQLAPTPQPGQFLSTDGRSNQWVSLSTVDEWPIGHDIELTCAYITVGEWEINDLEDNVNVHFDGFDATSHQDIGTNYAPGTLCLCFDPTVEIEGCGVEQNCDRIITATIEQVCDQQYSCDEVKDVTVELWYNIGDDEGVGNYHWVYTGLLKPDGGAQPMWHD